jgi:hypothetical protein
LAAYIQDLMLPNPEQEIRMTSGGQPNDC